MISITHWVSYPLVVETRQGVRSKVLPARESGVWTGRCVSDRVGSDECEDQYEMNAKHLCLKVSNDWPFDKCESTAVKEREFSGSEGQAAPPFTPD